jgi:hypothetical protein
MKTLSIKGYNVGDLLMDPIKNQEGIRFVQERLGAGQIRPIVSRDVVEGQQYLVWSSHFANFEFEYSTVTAISRY